MKCGIITFHRAINFGAILQTYALQSSLEKLGVDCEVIDYRSEFIERYYQPLSLNKLPNIKRVLAIVLKNGVISENRQSFIDFSEKYLKRSTIIYKSKQDMKKSNEKYDVFISGSDQVWSYITAGFDKNYFLDFVTDEKKKSSYAASFGVENIPEEYKKEYIKLLSSYENVSVREEQGAKIIRELLGTTPQVVLDPTLLLDRNEWEKIASGKSENQRYLLLYLIAESKKIITMAKKIAKERNLKIIYINDRWYKRRGMESRSKTSVNDFINLFLNADCVVTNSFHGICFSINFKKEFFVQLLPEPAKVNSRLENILNMFNLSDRRVEDLQTLKLMQPINYKVVHKKLNDERMKAKEYLNGVIK